MLNMYELKNICATVFKQLHFATVYDQIHCAIACEHAVTLHNSKTEAHSGTVLMIILLLVLQECTVLFVLCGEVIALSNYFSESSLSNGSGVFFPACYC